MQGCLLLTPKSGRPKAGISCSFLMDWPDGAGPAQANFTTNRPSTAALAVQYCGFSFGSSPLGTIVAASRSGATVRSAAPQRVHGRFVEPVSSTPAG